MNLDELRNAPPDVRDRELRRMVAESERICSAEGVDVVLSEEETRALNLPPSRYTDEQWDKIVEVSRPQYRIAYGLDKKEN